jgi:hypothetical protein
MLNEYWEQEEFEDLVSRALIALYENKMQKECLKVPKFIKPNDKDITQLRNIGAYFAPNDRCIMGHEIDLINDGLPKEASWAYNPLECGSGKQKKDLLKGEYFRLGYLRLIDKAPTGILNIKGLKYFGKHKIYKFLSFSATEMNGMHLMKSYTSIDEEGQIYDTYARKQDGTLQTVAHGSMDIDEDKESIISDIGWTSAVVGFYQDRRHLWNVTANEGIAKATFGVYPEEIKSLFYAREMPMTETGRKRPILHWVAAHNRRLKNGIDIDIEKHLRGINEFVYQGTKFIITRPIKNNSISQNIVK